MNCKSELAIHTKKSEHTFPHKTSTQVLEVDFSEFVEIKAKGAVGTKEHCGTTTCEINNILATTSKCGTTTPTGDFRYDATAFVADNFKISVKSSKEGYWKSTSFRSGVAIITDGTHTTDFNDITPKNTLCIRCTNKMSPAWQYENRLTIKRDKSDECFRDMTYKTHTKKYTGSTGNYEFGWKGAY